MTHYLLILKHEPPKHCRIFHSFAFRSSNPWLKYTSRKKEKSLLFRHKGEIKRATNERIKFSMIPIAFSEIQQRDLQLISFFTRWKSLLLSVLEKINYQTLCEHPLCARLSVNRLIKLQRGVSLSSPRSRGTSNHAEERAGMHEKMQNQTVSGCQPHMCICAQLCLTLCDSMDCSLPGSSVHGIFQARILEWVAVSFSRGPSWPRNRTHIICISGWILYESPRKPCQSPARWD